MPLIIVPVRVFVQICLGSLGWLGSRILAFLLMIKDFLGSKRNSAVTANVRLGARPDGARRRQNALERSQFGGVDGMVLLVRAIARPGAGL